MPPHIFWRVKLSLDYSPLEVFWVGKPWVEDEKVKRSITNPNPQCFKPNPQPSLPSLSLLSLWDLRRRWFLWTKTTSQGPHALLRLRNLKCRRKPLIHSRFSKGESQISHTQFLRILLAWLIVGLGFQGFWSWFICCHRRREFEGPISSRWWGRTEAKRWGSRRFRCEISLLAFWNSSSLNN